jgi:hypothetical protein
MQCQLSVHVCMKLFVVCENLLDTFLPGILGIVYPDLNPHEEARSATEVHIGYRYCLWKYIEHATKKSWG